MALRWNDDLASRFLLAGLEASIRPEERMNHRMTIAALALAATLATGDTVRAQEGIGVPTRRFPRQSLAMAPPHTP